MYIPPDKLDRLKDEFDLYNYLLARGFKFLPKDSVRSSHASDGYEYRIMKLSYGQGSSLTLTLSKLPSGRYVYANLHDDSDKGSCLDFFMNHENQSFKEALVSINSTGSKRAIATYKKTKPVEKVEEPYLTVINTEPFRFEKYFEGRGILTTILGTPFIRDSMAKVNYCTKEQKDKILYTHGFKLRDAKGEVLSYNLRGSMHPDGLFSGPRNKSLWYASQEVVRTLVIGESAIDCISYFKLNGEKLTDPMLISSEGRFSKNYAHTLRELVGEGLKGLNIVFVNDNDLYGYFYDLSWIKYLFDMPYEVSIKKEKSTGVSLIIIKTSDQKLQFLLDLDEDENMELGSLDNCLRVINKLIAGKPMRVHKSKNRDWNEDLNKS